MPEWNTGVLRMVGEAEAMGLDSIAFINESKIILLYISALQFSLLLCYDIDIKRP